MHSSMRFYLFAVLSGLAALAVVSAPDGSWQTTISPEALTGLSDGVAVVPV